MKALYQHATCATCLRTSHHPQDVKEGYCGSCHAFTGTVDVCRCHEPGAPPTPVPYTMLSELRELRAVETYRRARRLGHLDSVIVDHDTARQQVLGTRQRPVVATPSHDVWWTHDAVAAFQQIHGKWSALSHLVFDVVAMLARNPDGWDEATQYSYRLTTLSTHRVAYDVDHDQGRVYVVHVSRTNHD